MFFSCCHRGSIMYSVFFLVVIMVLLCEIRVHGQTPQSNQGSQGRQRAKPGFRQQITIENRGQRERTQRKRGPETRKHATRVPRSRKEANKGSRGSQRGKQGFPGVEKRQTRVHSGLKEANKGSQVSQRLGLRVRVVLSLVRLSTEIANFWRSV